MFAAKTKLGTSDTSSADVALPTRHQGAIMYLSTHGPTAFTTSGTDGRVVFWPLAEAGVDVRAAGLA